MRIPPTYTTYFSNHTQKEKSEIFSFNIITRHNQLHKKHINISNNIQKSRTDILKSTGFLPPKNFKKIWPVDWLVFYDYYSRKPRDNIFTYDKLIVTASYWRSKNSETTFPLIEYNREKEHSVSPSPETIINYVQTVYTNFCTSSSTTKYINLNNDIKIRQPFFHDDFEKGSYKYYASEQTSISTDNLTTEFDTEFGYYDFINLYFEEDDEFYKIKVREEKEQCLKENSEKFLSVSDFPISNYELELRKTKNLDFSSSFAQRVYHVCDFSTESPTIFFRTDEISHRTYSYHHQCTNSNKNPLDNSIDTYVYSTENNTDPMYESFFLSSNNDSESYFYDTCDDSVGSLTSQRSSELSFQHSIRNYDDCPQQKNCQDLILKILPIFCQKQENFSLDNLDLQI